MVTCKKYTTALLTSGILSSLLYPATDIVAGNLYHGYSFNQQAVSELFAIGSPVSELVVPLFTISSTLLVAFALGVWILSNNSRMLHFLSIMIFANAVDSLILWNCFPMHMREDQKTFTDLMHLILAVNPVILISVVLGAIYFKGWFRLYSAGTVCLLIIPAIMAFS